MLARGRLGWLLAGAALFAGVLALAAVIADSGPGFTGPVDQSPSPAPPLLPEPPAPAAGELAQLRFEVDDPIGGEPEVDADLRMPGYSGAVKVEIRGGSSVSSPKPSYGFELDAPAAGVREAPLLGMPEDADWVLHAPYTDKTLMRSALAYGTSRAIGRYAPRTRFVELYLNDRYRGVYVLTEQPELEDRRIAGDALVEFTSVLEAGGEGEAFQTPVRGLPVVWRDPERDDLEDEEADDIAQLVGRAERALYSRPLGDPGDDWRRFLDEDSAVDVALLNELFKNQRGFESSTYLARRGDGRLHLGPVWDFDVGMANSNLEPSEGVTGWMLERRDWAERLYQDPEFALAFAQRWRELRGDGLRQRLLATVDSHRALLRGEAQRNFRRWPILGEYVWPNPRDPRTGEVRQTYQAEVDHLRGWLDRRVAWIDEHVDEL
jgi:hypothetical protein